MSFYYFSIWYFIASESMFTIFLWRVDISFQKWLFKYWNQWNWILKWWQSKCSIFSVNSEHEIHITFTIHSKNGLNFHFTQNHKVWKSSIGDLIKMWEWDAPKYNTIKNKPFYLFESVSCASNISKTFKNHWLLCTNQNGWYDALNLQWKWIPVDALIDFFVQITKFTAGSFTKMAKDKNVHHRPKA